MQLANAPSKIVLPFAASGGKNTIPVPSQIGITGGAASFTDGFPPLTRSPISAGGIPPFGLDMNGILYDVSAIVLWANAGAGYIYDSTFATNSNIGGYPKGARILRTDGTGYWLNLTDNNTTDPETSGAAAAGWVPDFTNGVAPVTMTNANVTLTQLQYGKPIIIITGLLTANLNLVFPNIAQEWTVINATTGAFTINGKTASGTGIALTGISILTCDGANNMYNASGSLTGALLAANNLSDLASLATALTNLGFGSSAGSNGYFKVPDPTNPTKPWIIQYCTATIATGGTLVTLPLTFPNNHYIDFITKQSGFSEVWAVPSGLSQVSATLNTGGPDACSILAIGK